MTVLSAAEDKRKLSERAEALSAAAPGLSAWFTENARRFPWREDRTPYKVLVSETMLQQTRIEAVLKYYGRFTEAFPTLRALAEAPSDRVMKAWEGLGYYSRARNLKKCAEICAEHRDGVLPETFDELVKLPGIGEYSAGAIASLCHDEPVPAVDGNVLRVLARFFGDGRDVRLPEVRREAAADITAVLAAGAVKPSAFNEGLMELGETLCAPKGRPQCGECPLRNACRAHAQGKEEALPVRSAGKARRVEEKTVWIFCSRGRIALEKRPDAGMLRGLYGFPMTEGTVPGTEEAEALLREKGIVPLSVMPFGKARHVFTHREWQMTAYFVETEAKIPGLIYARHAELVNEYALPSAFRPFRNRLVTDS